MSSCRTRLSRSSAMPSVTWSAALQHSPDGDTCIRIWLKFGAVFQQQTSTVDASHRNVVGRNIFFLRLIASVKRSRRWSQTFLKLFAVFRCSVIALSLFRSFRTSYTGNDVIFLWVSRCLISISLKGSSACLWSRPFLNDFLVLTISSKFTVYEIPRNIFESNRIIWAIGLINSESYSAWWECLRNQRRRKYHANVEFYTCRGHLVAHRHNLSNLWDLADRSNSAKLGVDQIRSSYGFNMGFFLRKAFCVPRQKACITGNFSENRLTI